MMLDFKTFNFRLKWCFAFRVDLRLPFFSVAIFFVPAISYWEL